MVVLTGNNLQRENWLCMVFRNVLNEILEIPIRLWTGCQYPNIDLLENKQQGLSLMSPSSVLLGFSHVISIVGLGGWDTE